MPRKLTLKDFYNPRCDGCWEVWCLLINRRLWLRAQRKDHEGLMPRSWNPDIKAELKKTHLDDCKIGKRLKGRTHV